MENQPLGELAATGIRKIAEDLIDGAIPIANASQAAAVIKVLYEVHRLEDNAPTQITSSRDVLIEIEAELRDKLKAGTPQKIAELSQVNQDTGDVLANRVKIER